MRSHHPKIKQPPRNLFSCGIFGHCTETVLSPTAAPPSVPGTTSAGIQLTQPLPGQPPPPSFPSRMPESPPDPSSSSSSSSSDASQSFTQWRLPLPNTPLLLHRPTDYEHLPPPPAPPPVRMVEPGTTAVPVADLAELLHVAELQFAAGNAKQALRLLEQNLVPNPPASGGGAPIPVAVIEGVVRLVGEDRAAVKVLLALLLAEPSRRPALEAGAVRMVIEALPGLGGGAATERALAVLELLCTTADGVVELRGHALAVPLLLEMVGRMSGRGAEYALSVLAAVCAEGPVAESTVAPEGLAQVVALAMQGQHCSARTKRKGMQLLASLQEKWGLHLAGA